MQKLIERGVDGEKDNAKRILEKHSATYRDLILQITSERLNINFQTNFFDSPYNEVLVVPVGEGARADDYMAKLGSYLGDEFSTVGFTQNRLINGRRNVGLGFIGPLQRALEGIFCSIHILSTLRSLYGLNRESKRGYIDALRKKGLGKRNKNSVTLRASENAANFFGVALEAPRTEKHSGAKYFQGFFDGTRDGFSYGSNELAYI